MELVRAAEQARCGRVAVLLVYVIFNLHTQGSCVRYLCLYVLYRKWGSYDWKLDLEGGKRSEIACPAKPLSWQPHRADKPNHSAHRMQYDDLH